MSIKARIEAVLFLTDKPLAAAAVAQLVNMDVQEVRQAILELIHDYEQRNCALEISDDGGYMMQVKDEFSTFANDMAPVDLPVSVVRTLSAIAIKQPVLQSEIVRIRGAGAYDHIKELLEKELITKKEEGRSSLLNTTKKFQEYFRLSQDARALRDQLQEQSKTQPLEGGESPIDSGDLTSLDNVIAASEAENITAGNEAVTEEATQNTSFSPDDDIIVSPNTTQFAPSN